MAHIDRVVLEVLLAASSQNPQILKPAEEKLKEWETQPGFYTTLNSVISDITLDVNVRWIAVLCMKNGVDRYWKKNSLRPIAIADEEKQTIKRNLLLSFNEPINQIAVQRAVLIAKIARMDCPRDWPELFPTLLQAVESPDEATQHRSLLTLHHVIKAIASKRLSGDRRIFQEFTASIYNYILNLWNKHTQAFLKGTAEGADMSLVIISLEKALLTLRILRKLTVFGFYKPYESSDCMNFLNNIFEKARTVLQCRKQLKGKDNYALEVCQKYIVHLTKVLISVLDVHPFTFVQLIEPTFSFTFYYLFTDEGITFIFERFIIQCLNLIKNILLCAEYRTPKIPELSKNQETLQAHQMKLAFFQPQTTSDICRKLILHYFLLTKEELEMWDADPEAFANDESGDSWKYSLRPCMETVFVTIFHEFRVQLIPLILDLIRENNTLVSPDDMPGILRKDAVYNAVSLCAFDLYGEVDFDQWLTTILLQELKIKHNNYRVIRRRVTALIGRWTGINLSPSLRPTLYECIINLLGKDEDMAVRLTASQTLKFAIDDFEFNPDQFNDYLFPAFNLLFMLLKDATECETKMLVLNVMTLLLERMGQILIPHSEALIQYLPHMWQESEDHNMLRCAIVATLVQVVRAMGGVNPELNQFLFPIIELGTDTKQGAIVYLLEDVLQLWLAVLEHSSNMSSELMQLFNNMPNLLEYSTENLKICLQICITHLLLSPEAVMRTHGLQIISVCDGMMYDLKSEGIVLMMRLIDTFIRAVPQLGTETVTPILPKIFNKIQMGEDFPMVMSTYLCILSRVLLSSHEIFTRVLVNLSQLLNQTEQAVLSKIMDVWLNTMPNVGQNDQRKLLGLALTYLLTTQNAQILQRFESIMVNLLETLNDITVSVSEETEVMTDSLVLHDGQSPSHFEYDGEGYYETDHYQRKKALILSDPVHTIVLKDYLQAQLRKLQEQLGSAQYQQLIQTLDEDTIQQFQDYLTF